MKKFVSLLCVTAALMLAGCGMNEEGKAIRDVKTVVLELRDLTQNGVTFAEYNKLADIAGATILLAGEDIVTKDGKKEIEKYLQAAKVYGMAQYIWAMQQQNEVMSQFGVILLPLAALPDDVDQRELREESLRTIRSLPFELKAEDEKSVAPEQAGILILPTKSALKIYWNKASKILDRAEKK